MRLGWRVYIPPTTTPWALSTVQRSTTLISFFFPGPLRDSLKDRYRSEFLSLVFLTRRWCLSCRDALQIHPPVSRWSIKSRPGPLVSGRSIHLPFFYGWFSCFTVLCKMRTRRSSIQTLTILCLRMRPDMFLEANRPIYGILIVIPHCWPGCYFHVRGTVGGFILERSFFQSATLWPAGSSCALSRFRPACLMTGL